MTVSLGLVSFWKSNPKSAKSKNLSQYLALTYGPLIKIRLIALRKMYSPTNP